MHTGVKGVVSSVFLLSLLLGCSPSNETADDPAFSAANGIKGGIMYDEFWAEEIGFHQANTAHFDQYPDFFRCVQCHGWDLLGRAGGFASFNNAFDQLSSSRPNAANFNLYETAKVSGSSDLFNAIKNGNNPAIRRGLSADLSTYDPDANSVVGDQMPNYAEILSDEQVWDLVKFLKTEAVDVKQLYDFTVSGAYPTATVTYSNIGKDGNVAQGDSIYSTYCSSTNCHGFDGTENVGLLSVGGYIRYLSHRQAHMIKFGVLGTGMAEMEFITLQQLKSLFKALADDVKYP